MKKIIVLGVTLLVIMAGNLWGQIIISVNPGEINVSNANFNSDKAIHREYVTVTNEGSGTLTWTAELKQEAYWVWLEAASGGDGDTLKVVFRIANLPSGVYRDTIYVADAEAVNSPVELSLQLVLVTDAITGAVCYYSTSGDVDDVILKNGVYFADTTLWNGEYSLYGLHGQACTVVPEKENDLQNSISALDAAWILQYGAGLRELTPYQMLAADVSGNGSVSAFDASRILQYCAGMISYFPVMDDSTHFWRFVPGDFAIDEDNWNAAPRSVVYDSLVGDVYDDYVGLVYGDVTGNWSPLDRLEKTALTAEEILLIPQPWGKKGHVSDIRIWAREARGFLSFELVLNYDPELLRLEQISKNYEGTMMVSDTNGKLCIAFASALPVYTTKSLFILEIESLRDIAFPGVPLEIESLKIDEVRYRVTSGMPSQSSAYYQPGDYQLQSHPNPFTEVTTVHFQLPGSQEIRLYVYNVLGQRVGTLIGGWLEGGLHSVTWDGAGCGAGIYFVALEAGRLRMVRKVVRF